MTRDEILQLATDAGFSVVFQHHESEAILNFAVLIAAQQSARLGELQTINEQLLDILEKLVDEALYDGAYLGKND